MKITLIDREPAHIAYMRHIGAYGEPISQFWQTVAAPWMAMNGLMDRPRYGISHDDPAIATAGQNTYDAGAEVPVGFSGTGDYHTTVIPGGKYASTPFNGTSSDIVDAWAKLLHGWLPESGMKLDARPFFEYYSRDDSFDPKTGTFTCSLIIPVVSP